MAIFGIVLSFFFSSNLVFASPHYSPDRDWQKAVKETKLHGLKNDLARVRNFNGLATVLATLTPLDLVSFDMRLLKWAGDTNQPAELRLVSLFYFYRADQPEWMIDQLLPLADTLMLSKDHEFNRVAMLAVLRYFSSGTEALDALLRAHFASLTDPRLIAIYLHQFPIPFVNIQEGIQPYYNAPSPEIRAAAFSYVIQRISERRMTDWTGLIDQTGRALQTETDATVKIRVLEDLSKQTLAPALFKSWLPEIIRLKGYDPDINVRAAAENAAFTLRGGVKNYGNGISAQMGPSLRHPIRQGLTNVMARIAGRLDRRGPVTTCSSLFIEN